LALVLSLMVAGTAAAQEDASVYVVHGIPGALVDVCVDGGVAIPNFEFGTIFGPVPFAPGTYNVAIAAADGTCGNIILGPLALTFEAGKSYSAVAYLMEDGTPTAGLFENDISPTARGAQRIIAHHTAQAPEVDVVISRDYYSNGNPPTAVIPGFANGVQAQGEFRPGDWDLALEVGGDTVFGPATLYDLKPFTAYLAYAVGVFGTDSFSILIQPVPGLK
jgi:hypothetical protein